MLWTPITIFYFLAVIIASFANIVTFDALKSAQSRILNTSEPYCFPSHSGSRHAFMGNKWKSQLGDIQAIVYPFCLQTKELGNRLGNFFTEVACAESSGLHFISIHKQFDMAGSFHGVSNTSLSASPDGGAKQKLAFLNALPDVIVHPNPLDRDTATREVLEHCKCTRYCWGDGRAPWVNKTESVGKYIRNAVAAYMSVVDSSVGTTVSPDTDLSNAKPGEQLPIVPDVAIQYRCGDNIQFSYMYGILPFTAFATRIPKGMKYIYVLSDHPSRALHSPYSSRCKVILQSLFDYLKVRNPESTIVVKRGGDLFLDYARLSLSKVTICSASTYCLWPALANQGQVYFPLSVLVAGADSMELAPDFGPRFHWIDEPKIISDFRKVRPWTNILEILQGKMSLPK